MKLKATQPLRYGGRDLQAGDEFETSDRDGKILKAIRKASDAEVAPEVVSAEHAGIPVQGSRHYQTRRMKAKD